MAMWGCHVEATVTTGQALAQICATTKEKAASGACPRRPQICEWDWHPMGHLMTGASGGVFAQRAHSASYYGVYPGNSPENLPPLEACMSNSKV